MELGCPRRLVRRDLLGMLQRPAALQIGGDAGLGHLAANLFDIRRDRQRIDLLVELQPPVFGPSSLVKARRPLRGWWSLGLRDLSQFLNGGSRDGKTNRQIFQRRRPDGG
jgi:hypothetical protein